VNKNESRINLFILIQHSKWVRHLDTFTYHTHLYSSIIPFSERKSSKLLKWVGESLKTLFVRSSNCRNLFLQTYNQGIS